MYIFIYNQVEYIDFSSTFNVSGPKADLTTVCILSIKSYYLALFIQDANFQKSNF